MLSQDKEGAEWKEMQLSPSTDSIALKELSFGSGYQLEVIAVNANGSSLPSMFNFTIGEQPGMCPPYSLHHTLEPVSQEIWHNLLKVQYVIIGLLSNSYKGQHITGIIPMFPGSYVPRCSNWELGAPAECWHLHH